METTVLSVEYLMGCALHPDTWLAWVPEEVLKQIPFDISISISCTPNGVWVIADREHKVIYSSSLVEIEPEAETQIVDCRSALEILKTALYAKVQPSEPEPPKAA